MSEANAVSESLTLAQVVGSNLARIRAARGLSVAEFATRMQEAVGRGWQRQEAYRYEKGDRAMTAEELMAAAMVLECSVAELVGSDAAVQVGTITVAPYALTDSLSRTSVESDGWARFEAAREALGDVRSAWARYTHEIDVARRRVADSPALRERIDAYRQQAIETAHTQVAQSDALDAEHARILGLPAHKSAVTPTPAIRAAEEALGTAVLPEHLWAIRPQREGRQ